MSTKAKTEAGEAVNRTARARVTFQRISPRKLRLVVDTIRFKPVGKADTILATLNKKGARIARKLLASAVANAKVLKLDESRLYVSDVRADQGPIMKRMRPRSMGRADRILKRMAHLSLTVTEGDRAFRGQGKAPAKSTEAEKPAAKKATRKKKAAKA